MLAAWDSVVLSSASNIRSPTCSRAICIFLALRSRNWDSVIEVQSPSSVTQINETHMLLVFNAVRSENIPFVRHWDGFVGSLPDTKT